MEGLQPTRPSTQMGSIVQLGGKENTYCVQTVESPPWLFSGKEKKEESTN